MTRTSWLGAIRFLVRHPRAITGAFHHDRLFAKALADVFGGRIIHCKEDLRSIGEDRRILTFGEALFELGQILIVELELYTIRTPHLNRFLNAMHLRSQGSRFI